MYIHAGFLRATQIAMPYTHPGAVLGLERTAYAISEGESTEVCVEVLSGRVDESNIDLNLATEGSGSAYGDSMLVNCTIFSLRQTR